MDMSFAQQRKAMVESFIMATNDKAYKHGAFRGQITTATSVEDSLRLFINSSLVTNEEKSMYFLPMYRCWIKLEQAFQRNPNFDWVLQSGAIFEGFQVFENDMKARGMYVAPMMIQTLGDDGKVTSTHTIDSQGATAMHKDGELGIPPGAPPEYQKAQRDKVAKMRLGKKMSKGTNSTTKSNGERAGELRTKKPKDSMARHASKNHSSEIPERADQGEEKKEPGRENCSDGQVCDFGAAFKKGIKRFFE